MIDELISQEIEKSLDALFRDNQGATLTRHKVQHVMGTLSQHVAQHAKSAALLSLRTSQEVADLYGVSRQSINTRAARLRARRGGFGWQVGRGWWVFTPEEVEALRPKRPGRPKAGEPSQGQE